MDFLLEELDDKRIGIFSDLHIGVSSDSKMRLNETKKCLKWVIKSFKKEHVDWVIFCGDLFNSRFSINVNTLNAGIEMIEDLAYNFEKVFLIEGNHDTYYKNSNQVNSVTFLQKVGKNDNIYVVDEKPMFFKIGAKTFGLYPWGFTPGNADSISNFQTPDYGFGHFEMNGVEMTGFQKSSGSKYSIHDMFKLGDMLFSGHYHANKIYKDLYTDKILYMIGSPLQLDWGDYGKDKKIVILQPSTGEIKEIQNETNAMFKKIFYSDLEASKFTDDELKKMIKHNFIKFIIDVTYKFENILKFSDHLKSFDPYTFELDYLITFSTDGALESKIIDIANNDLKTNKDYIMEYIDTVFEQYKKTDETLDLDFLKSLALSYYDKSQTDEDEDADEGDNE